MNEGAGHPARRLTSPRINKGGTCLRIAANGARLHSGTVRGDSGDLFLITWRKLEPSEHALGGNNKWGFMAGLG